VAACDSAQFTGLKAKQPDSLARVEDADGNPVPDDTSTVANRKSSPLLSVWRRVHLELDSMAAGSDVTYTRNIDKITNNRYHTQDGACELNSFEPNDNGRYEGGTLTVTNTGNTYVVVDNVDVLGDDDVVTVGPVAQADKNKTGILKDDDGTELPRTVLIGLVNEKFKPAYIESIEVTSASDANNTFEPTIANTPAKVIAVGSQNKDLQTEPGYWVALFVSCHQGKDAATDTSSGIKSLADGDPDFKYHIHTTPAFTNTGDSAFLFGSTVPDAENITVVFLETIRDYGAQSGAGIIPPPDAQTAANVELISIPHELGHQFGLDPSTSDRHKAGTVMEASIVDPSKVFDEQQILHLRSNSSFIEN
jgi:hypothetical protein